MAKERSKEKKELGEWVEELEDGFEEHEMTSRTVFLVGGVEEARIKRAIKSVLSLAEASKPDDPIYLWISTEGGAVEEAFALYDVMKFIPNPIHTYGFGKVMSAGCLLLAAGEAGKRFMAPNSVLMYHAGWDETTGNIWEMQTYVDYFRRQERQYDALFAQECGRTLEEVENLYQHIRGDVYIAPDAALAFGVVDSIMPIYPRKLRGTK